MEWKLANIVNKKHGIPIKEQIIISSISGYLMQYITPSVRCTDEVFDIWERTRGEYAKYVLEEIKCSNVEIQAEEQFLKELG